MLKFKCIKIMAVLFIFLMAVQSEAVVVVNNRTAGKPSPPATKILKVMGTAAKIENNILYLASGKKYSLSGVKVAYSRGKPISKNKKMAEMFFVNGVLEEVTVR